MGKPLPTNFEERAQEYRRLGYTGAQIARTLRVCSDTVLKTLAPSQTRAQRRQAAREIERARRRAITKALTEHWENTKTTAHDRILADPNGNLLTLSAELGVSLHRLNGLHREMRDSGEIRDQRP